MSSHNQPPTEPKDSGDTEHYLRPGDGTQTACSCGKSFALSDDARQHIEWQLRTARTQLIQEIEEAIGPDEPRTKHEDNIAGKKWWDGRLAGTNAERARIRKILESKRT